MFGLKPRARPGPDRDLGFGTAASSVAGRLLNRDGSFNSRREGLGWFASLHVYDAVLTMRWSTFLFVVALAYLSANTLFALTYTALGPDALSGPGGEMTFRRAFFFSVHTLSTVGYGHIVPATPAASVLMTLQSLFGLFGVALTTGVVFARFARPTAKILFSDNAVIAPYRDQTGLMFRIANQRSTQIIEVDATVVFSKMEEEDGRRVRRFYPLSLERSKVVFFPLQWTIVHPIDKSSPLHGLTEGECLSSDAELLVLLKGIDETFSQVVHTRSSYKADEIRWHRRFADIYLREDAHIVGIDLSRLSETREP